MPPYTDGFAGSAPDAGAFETGRAAWTSGAGGAVEVPDDTAPATPRGLAASASPAGVTLDWLDALDADRMGYFIYRAAAAAGPFDRITDAPWTESRYLDSDAPQGSRSYYRVVTVDTSENVSAAATADTIVETPGAVPPAPTGLLAAPASGTAVDLTWDPAGDVFGYRIERRGPGETSYKEVGHVDRPSFRNAGLTPGASYSYRVRAENLRGVSDPGAAVAASPLAAPAGLTVAVAGAMRADLFWGNVAGESRFDVQRSRDGKAGWLTIAATMPDVTTYSDVSVPTSQPYFYRVVTVGPGGGSPASNVAGTGAQVSAYDSADINAIPAGRTTVVDADTAFDVTGGGADVNGSSDRFRFVSRQITGDFDVRVRLESLGRASAWTKAGLMARQGLGGGSRNVFVLATPDVNGYRISSRVSDGGSTLVTGTGGGAAAYPNAWLRLRRVGPVFTGYRSSDGVHWFVVGSRTIDMPARLYFGMAITSHNTAATATARFRDLSDVRDAGPVVPAAPGGLTASAASANQVDLDWDASAGATGYRIERKGPGESAFGEVARATATNFRDASVAAGATYAYRVRAENAAGVSVPTALVSVTTPSPLNALIGVDVGGPVPAGSTRAIAEGRDYDLTAGGTDVNGATDRFHFAYRQVTGDFDVKVRLQSLGATSDWAKAGIMAREDLTGGSRNVFALATPGANGYRVSSRSATNGSTFVNGSGVVAYPNTWLRLQRQGGNFIAYRSADGITWAQIGSTRTLDLPETLYLGLAATSHNTTATTKAEFREFGDV
jgi:fibronectin type 3 domain-containing protein